ncbi:hypothetical protein MTO96_003261 [Rhipicephalus appendiculatus]
MWSYVHFPGFIKRSRRRDLPVATASATIASFIRKTPFQAGAAAAHKEILSRRHGRARGGLEHCLRRFYSKAIRDRRPSESNIIGSVQSLG